ncbi:MAG: hypothetical protein NTW26_00535, partial [bacterium]|nr:hypothetical protein [bacterium]
MSYEPHEPLVLVAGTGRLPLVAARSHRTGGGRLHLVSLSRQIPKELEELATEAVIFSVGQVGGIL